MTYQPHQSEDATLKLPMPGPAPLPCPICIRDYAHYHDHADVEIYRRGVEAGRALGVDLPDGGQKA